MVPYQTPMSSGPGPDPLQAALTNANQMTGQLAPTQPGGGYFGPAKPPYSQRYHDDWNQRHMHQRMRDTEALWRERFDQSPRNPFPAPAPKFPNVQEQVPRMNERIMRDMQGNRRPSLPKPSAMPQPPRANPTGAAHKPHQPMQY